MIYVLWWVCLLLDGPVVENGFAPVGKPRNLVLVEDLRFGGGDEDEVYLWTGSNPTVTADPEGNMYVADPGSHRILKFNPQGKFAKQIGRRGEGPGEYLMLHQFTVFTDGSALGYDVMGDSTRFLFYDKNLNYVRDAKIKDGHIYRAHHSPDGKWMGVYYLTGFRGVFQNIWGVMDRDFNWKVELNRLPLEGWNRDKLNDRNYLTGRFGKLFAIEQGSHGLVALGSDGVVYTALSGKYEISRWRGDWKKPEMIITRKYKPVVRSAEEIETIIEDFQARTKERIPPLADRFTFSLMKEAYEKSGVSPAHNPIFGMLALPGGHLVVLHTRGADGSQTGDLFDPQGKLIGQATAPHGGFWDTDEKPRMIFRGNYAYTIETVDDEHQVVRYRHEIKP